MEKPKRDDKEVFYEYPQFKVIIIDDIGRERSFFYVKRDSLGAKEPQLEHLLIKVQKLLGTTDTLYYASSHLRVKRNRLLTASLDEFGGWIRIECPCSWTEKNTKLAPFVVLAIGALFMLASVLRK
mmetsp:Transcript_1804/g.1987  ORF Transcript_1804/g.1987 Transcript_1804/m.1987 type:complete len:126 (+) Transcript_1804:75-452(+)